MKKILACILILCLTAFIFCSCTGNDTPDDTVADTTPVTDNGGDNGGNNGGDNGGTQLPEETVDLGPVSEDPENPNEHTNFY